MTILWCAHGVFSCPGNEMANHTSRSGPRLHAASRQSALRVRIRGPKMYSVRQFRSAQSLLHVVGWDSFLRPVHGGSELYSDDPARLGSSCGQRRCARALGWPFRQTRPRLHRTRQPTVLSRQREALYRTIALPGRSPTLNKTVLCFVLFHPIPFHAPHHR